MNITNEIREQLKSIYSDILSGNEVNLEQFKEYLESVLESRKIDIFIPSNYYISYGELVTKEKLQDAMNNITQSIVMLDQQNANIYFPSISSDIDELNKQVVSLQSNIESTTPGILSSNYHPDYTLYDITDKMIDTKNMSYVLGSISNGINTEITADITMDVRKKSGNEEIRIGGFGTQLGNVDNSMSNIEIYETIQRKLNTYLIENNYDIVDIKDTISTYSDFVITLTFNFTSKLQYFGIEFEYPINDIIAVDIPKDNYKITLTQDNASLIIYNIDTNKIAIRFGLLKPLDIAKDENVSFNMNKEILYTINVLTNSIVEVQKLSDKEELRTINISGRKINEQLNFK